MADLIQRAISCSSAGIGRLEGRVVACDGRDRARGGPG
jgi:hypothetical protein